LDRLQHSCFFAGTCAFSKASGAVACPPVGDRCVNAITIDVEDYFHVSAFEKSIPRSQWDSYPLRVEKNTLVLLDTLDDCGVKATFFVLGWVAARIPGLARRIQERGHEIACHGFGHERLYLIGPDRFRDDVRHAKRLLEDQCGRPVIGYRAPSFSITSSSLWAVDILIEEGFLYDSSIFPVHHDLYGMPGADPLPHRINGSSGALQEFPPATFDLRIGGKLLRLPVAGGGYLRLFPLWVTRQAIARINRRHRSPAVVYLHPWEIDPGQPRVRAGLKSRFRHYCNLGTTLDKLRALLSCFAFAPMGRVLGLDAHGVS
jgi:polysaccharide deacetylase family protein (PEP-CTERM system associated)